MGGAGSSCTSGEAAMGANDLPGGDGDAPDADAATN